jgi:hypothetical protein
VVSTEVWQQAAELFNHWGFVGAWQRGKVTTLEISVKAPTSHPARFLKRYFQGRIEEFEDRQGVYWYKWIAPYGKKGAAAFAEGILERVDAAQYQRLQLWLLIDGTCCKSRKPHPDYVYETRAQYIAQIRTIK